MDKDQVAFIICADDEQCYNECVRYIQDLTVPEGYGTDIIGIWEADTIASGYQAGMCESNAKYKVYLRQDAFILNKDLITDVLKIFQEDEDIGMLGVIGASGLDTRDDGSLRWDVGRAVLYNGRMTVDAEYTQARDKGYTEVRRINSLIMATQYDIPWRDGSSAGDEILHAEEMQRRGYKVVVSFQDTPWCHCDSRIHQITDSDLSQQEYPEAVHLETDDDRTASSLKQYLIRILEKGGFHVVNEAVQKLRRSGIKDVQIKEIMELAEIYVKEKEDLGGFPSIWWKFYDWEQIRECYTWVRYVLMRINLKRQDERIEELQSMIGCGVVSRTAVRQISDIALWRSSHLPEKRLRIVIASAGLTEQEEEDLGEDCQIAAVISEEAVFGDEINGIPVLRPAALQNISYDLIAVCPDGSFPERSFEDIRLRLIRSYFMDPEKIIPWKALAGTEDSYKYDMVRVCVSLCETYGHKRILDLDTDVISRSYLNKGEIFGENIVFDGICSNIERANVCVYDAVYSSLKESGQDYDAAFIWDGLGCTAGDLKKVKDKARYVILFTPYLHERRSVKPFMQTKLGSYKNIKCIANGSGLIWIISPEIDEKDDMAIYVVTHKKANLKVDSLYRPLCVGGYQEGDYLSEKNGENIAYLNPQINECTALYWIWRNTSEKYVGLNHYRRYFYDIVGADHCLDQEAVYEILKEYDIILGNLDLGAPKAWMELTVYQRIHNLISDRSCAEGHRILREKIQKNQPEYLGAFDRVMAGKSMYVYNMFITHRDILDRYCEWLFSFLIEAVEELNVEGYDTRRQRMMGFFAESLLTVWLYRNKLRIKELERSNWSGWEGF